LRHNLRLTLSFYKPERECQTDREIGRAARRIPNLDIGAKVCVPWKNNVLPPLPFQLEDSEGHRAGLEEFGMSTKTGAAATMPQDVNTKLRALAHDLSNSIEAIMQASYLLAQSKLDANGKRWLDLIDNATRDAARINRDIREILRSQSAPTNP
jgi:signal transduction histidine kinase